LRSVRSQIAASEARTGVFVAARLIFRSFSSFRLASLLNRLQVIDRSLRIAPIEPEGRHLRVNRREPVLQSLRKILVVKLAVAEIAEGRCIDLRAATGLTDGVAARAERVEQFLAVLLFTIQRARGSAVCQGQQQCKTGSLHDGIPYAVAPLPRALWLPGISEHNPLRMRSGVFAADGRGVGSKITPVPDHRAR